MDVLRMAHHMQQISSEQFIDEYLVGEQFNIEERNGILYIDLFSGVHYYGELWGTIQINPDNSFKIIKDDFDLGTWQSDDLYDGLVDTLSELIHHV